MWSRLAEWILDHPRPILVTLAVLTAALTYEATTIRTDHRAGTFLSDETQAAQDFRRANELFGGSQTVLYLALRGVDPLDRSVLAALDAFVERVAAMEGVDNVLALPNIPLLARRDGRITSTPLYDAALSGDSLRARAESQPFLRGLLLSDDGTATAVLVNIEEAFNDTPERVDLVLAIEAAAQELPGEVALAGFPYLRTQYARRVGREAPLFTLMALLVSLVLLYLTFRDWRAVLLPSLVVLLGIAWTVGLIALFDVRLNIVTAMLPALIVIIGMATTIHLCTGFYDRFATLQDRRAALIETIRTVGVSTLLACLTTAVGFGVLVLSGSRLLAVFGTFAAIGILLLYVFAITLIPLAFLRIRPPSRQRASLVTHDRFADAFAGLARFTARRSGLVLGGALLVILGGLAGATRISTDIFVFSDFYQNDPLRVDLATFEESFGGVLPLEVVIDAERPNAFRTLGNLRRLDVLERSLLDLPEVTRAVSLVDLVKLANQASMGGHPATYRLPTSYELPFLQASLQDFMGGERGAALRNLPSFSDSSFAVARINLGVGDIGTTEMNALADSVRARTAAVFPDSSFTTLVTGTAIISTRSGENLVRNLIVSLGVALVVIAVLMAGLFRSTRLTLISLGVNVVPLLVVGGAMGFSGIYLKPSTALIFSLAFGIAVDASIHFLAKYRLVRSSGQAVDDALRTTLGETGKAILFNSLVLMAGFLVFTLSSFGGTDAMGGLTALTLGVAMVANLVLLPALLHRYGPRSELAAPDAQA